MLYSLLYNYKLQKKEEIREKITINLLKSKNILIIDQSQERVEERNA